MSESAWLPSTAALLLLLFLQHTAAAPGVGYALEIGRRSTASAPKSRLGGINESLVRRGGVHVLIS